MKIQKENIRRVVKPSVHCIVHGQRRLCILHLNKFQFILCKLPFRFCTTKICVLKYVIRVCIWMHIHDQLIRNQSCLSEIYVSLGLNFQNTTIILKHNFFRHVLISSCISASVNLWQIWRKKKLSCECKTEKLRGS